MTDNTLSILKPSVNNLTVRIFVRAAGLDCEEIDAWVEAARVAHVMEHNRLGVMGHYYGGMLDIYSDLTQQSAYFGGHIEILEVEELAALARPDGPWVVIDGYHAFMALEEQTVVNYVSSTAYAPEREHAIDRIYDNRLARQQLGWRPRTDLLGTEGSGFAPMQIRLGTRRLEMAAWSIGMAQRALDMTHIGLRHHAHDAGSRLDGTECSGDGDALLFATRHLRGVPSLATIQ